MKIILEIFGTLAVACAFALPAIAADDPATLQQQLDEQRLLLQTQQQKLDDQAKALERLDQRLIESMSGAGTAPAAASAPTAWPDPRDAVGDMNADAVKAGDFPGSIRIPGPGKVSLAIGGFIKTVAIFDSKAEGMGADFLPATLGADDHGAFSMDSALTRLYIDGRAPMEQGSVRGYVEYDLNASNNGSPGFKLRHAYGNWMTGNGTLTAGHTWSTMMDLKILPEGLTEPTVSGVIFVRQSILRWSQEFGEGFTYHVAIENPSSSDVFSAPSATSPARGTTAVPDGILALEYGKTGVGHVRLGGIVRRLEVTAPGIADSAATASGATLTGKLNFLKKDRLVLSGVYGKGLGRYLLGIESTAGSTFDPVQAEIDLRTNTGGMASYQHYWTDTLRSTVMTGRARSKPLDGQPGSTLESSTYSSINLMWSVRPYVTIGIEYAYGTRENVDNTRLDNQRIAIGIQVF